MHDLRVFKECSLCGKQWADRQCFLADASVEITGYMANFQKPEKGIFIFNHLHSDCNTTMALSVGLFKDLYTGEIFKQRLTGSADCPGYCLHQDETRPCDEQCEFAYIREIIQTIKKHPKSSQ